MGSTGRGRYPLAPDYVPWEWLWRPDWTGATAGHTIASDWFWGNVAPDPTEIPYSWLRPPVRFRPDPPVNTAEVGRTGGSTARAVDTNHRDALGYGEYTFRAELDTAVTHDPAALAGFMVAVHANDPPRQRIPALSLMLNNRTVDECQTILTRAIGDRISITGAPATWPEGTTSLVIEGIRHEIGVDARYVAWVTTPVVGDDPGEPGPWFRLDESFLDGPHELLF